MGVFRFNNKYLAPTTDQREKYMMGESVEKHFGPEDAEITFWIDRLR
jgi:hypothetical protein